MKPRILIVEDAPQVIDSLKALLASHYEIQTVSHKDLAITLLSNNRNKPPSQRFEVVVIDLTFQKANDREAGFDVLREAVLDPFLEPIIFTGTGDEDRAAKAWDLGAHRYIVKARSNIDSSASQKLTIAIENSIKFRRDLLQLFTLIESMKTELAVAGRDSSMSGIHLAGLNGMLRLAKSSFLAILHSRGRQMKEWQ